MSSALREAPTMRFASGATDAPLSDPIIWLVRCGARGALGTLPRATKPGCHFAACKNNWHAPLPSEGCLMIGPIARRANMRSSRLRRRILVVPGAGCNLWCGSPHDDTRTDLKVRYQRSEGSCQSANGLKHVIRRSGWQRPPMAQPRRPPWPRQRLLSGGGKAHLNGRH